MALAYQAKERELLVKEAAIYSIFMYDGQVGQSISQPCSCSPDNAGKRAGLICLGVFDVAWQSLPQHAIARRPMAYAQRRPACCR